MVGLKNSINELSRKILMSKKLVQVASKTPSMSTNCKHAHIFLHAEHCGFLIQIVNVYTEAYNTNLEVYKQL